MRNDCPFCHNQNGVLARNNQTLRTGEGRDIYRCGECHTLYPHPRMDENESLNWLTASHAKSKDKNYQSVTVVANRASFKRWIEPRGSVLNMGFLAREHATERGNALDIGASSGLFCHVLRSCGFAAHGLEVQEDAVKLARDNGLMIWKGSFPDEIPPELVRIKYSLISILECIYYIVDLKKGLEKAYEMLSDSGLLLVKCHQATSLYYRGDKNSLFKRYGDNVQAIPTLESMRYCLEKSGFEIIHISGALTKAIAPVNFGSFASNNALRKLLFFAESVLNKIYETTVLNIKDADQLIVCARKRQVKDV